MTEAHDYNAVERDYLEVAIKLVNLDMFFYTTHTLMS